MDSLLSSIFARLNNTADFAETDFSDVNSCAADGDNALHCVVRWNDVTAAEALLDAGIDVNKAGDLGYSPLHVACEQGNVQMVRLLVEHGADLFALTEGEAPMAIARHSGHAQICDFLGPIMEKQLSGDPKAWAQARINQLRNEIARLEKWL